LALALPALDLAEQPDDLLRRVRLGLHGLVLSGPSWAVLDSHTTWTNFRVANQVLQLVLGRAGFPVVPEGRQGPLAIVRVQAGLPGREGVGDLVVGVAEHALPAGGEIDRVGAYVPVPDAGVGAAYGQVEPLLAAAQRLLGPLTFDGGREHLRHGDHAVDTVRD